ncbi:MAG TPA: response regulator transcription factor [Bryobacteraceae bacterium]|jgi:DNA-binding NarL/FixJ family response regulator
MEFRILIADDHALIRQGIRALLSVDPDVRIVAEASDGREAVALAEKLRPDVAIIDIRMKELNGIDVISQLVRYSPSTAIIALSMFSDERYVNRAVRAGAKAYVLKDSSDDDLLRAVRAVQMGQSFFSPAVARVLLDAYARKDEAPDIEDRHELLSEREREVYQLLAEGRTNKMIADSLGVSIHTVETHRIRIMAKLDVHNMAELVLSAVRRGIVA